MKPLQAVSTTKTAINLTPTENQIDPASKYRNDIPQENVIFWGTPMAKTASLPERIRTMFWFYPDVLGRILHRLRPFSYLLLYIGLLFLTMRTVTYAGQNPNSLFGLPPEQHLIEGAIGTTSTLNPLFATNNQIDRDLQTLIFDRLIGIGQDGNPTPDLAKEWAISDEGTEYTFFLREDVWWHDGKKFTADDVVYTFTTIQKLENEDSFSSEFAEVTFQKIDDYSILVILPELNPTLMASLSFPVVPRHILSETSPAGIKYSDFNNFPVGTGPYKIITNTQTTVVLERNDRYFGKKPKIATIEYVFFPTEKEAITALKQFKIHTLVQASDDVVEAFEDYKAYQVNRFETPLRQKLIYINTRNQGPLTSSTVRHALSAATDRENLVKTIPSGGKAAYGTIPSVSWAYTETADRYSYDTARAVKLLEQAGWSLDQENRGSATFRVKDNEPLSITLTYLDTPSNGRIASFLQDSWMDLGINLILDPQTYERISSEIVPRRNFEMLLFEVEYTPDPDRYNLWHSTKSDYPGLNLSGYSNPRVDVVLERGRTTKDQEKRKNDYAILDRALMNDMPAIYLYSPTFTFIANTHVKGIELAGATLPQHRYNTIADWYITRTRLGWRNWQTR